MDDRTRALERAWREDRTWSSWLTWARAAERQGEPEASRLVFHAVRHEIRERRAARMREPAAAPYRIALMARDLMGADWAACWYAAAALIRRDQDPSGLAGIPREVRDALNRVAAELDSRRVDREAKIRTRGRVADRVRPSPGWLDALRAANTIIRESFITTAEFQTSLDGISRIVGRPRTRGPEEGDEGGRPSP